MNKHLIALSLAVAGIVVGATASAQTVRRCVGPDGSPFYTDTACPDATEGDVIRQESPEARAARQQSEADNYALAQQRAQADAQSLADAEARRNALLAERDAAIDDSINRARQRHAENQAEELFRKQVSALQRGAQGGHGISAREQRESRLALARLQPPGTAPVSGDPSVVQREAEARADDAEEQARAAEAEAQRALNEARRPKYDGNTGMWCQSPAPGVTNCHP